MKRRIAFHFYSLAQGGVERMRISLSHELLARGIDVDMVLVEKKGELLPLVPDGVRIIELGATRTASSVLPLARYLKEETPDAMFASLGPQNIAAIIARRLSGAKTWLGVMQHNALSIQAKAGISIQQALVPMAYRFFLKGADGVFGVSAGVADDMATTTGFPRDRIGVLYNPACPDGLDPDALPPVEHPFFESGDPVVIGVGRLVAQKGWDMLLRAFAQLVAQRPAKLLILGVGPEEEALKALIGSLGLEGKAELLGYRQGPLSWIRRSDLFVMSSRYEGFGNVIVEALAVGTPVVSTDCNYGPSEILDNGRFGMLLPVDDAGAMARAIGEALDRPTDRQALIARAQEFSVRHVVDNYLTAAFGKAE